MGKNPPTNERDVSSIPGLRKSPGEGNGNPLQYSYLGNPMESEVWLVTVHGITRVRRDLATKQQQKQFLGDNNILILWYAIKSPSFSERHMEMHACMLSCVWLFATPQTVAHQAPLSMEFSRERILEWVAISFSRGYYWATLEAHMKIAKDRSMYTLRSVVYEKWLVMSRQFLNPWVTWVYYIIFFKFVYIWYNY